MNGFVINAYSQIEEQDPIEQINSKLGICFDSLSAGKEIAQLQLKLDNPLCDLSTCILFYSTSNYLGLDTTQMMVLEHRIKEINQWYFKEGIALFLFANGGYSGGVFAFETHKEEHFEIIKITTPTTCVIHEMDERRSKVYSILNQQTKQFIRTTTSHSQ